MILVNVFDKLADKKMYGEEKSIDEERVPFV